MVVFFTMTGLGVLISILGMINRTGNISSLHSYHRHRVTEENRKPFGKLVGTGTLLIGIAIFLFGVLFLIFEWTRWELFVLIGTVILLAGLAAGMILSVYAMLKYNKGIF